MNDLKNAEDVDLILKAQEGHDTAFAELVRRYQGRLRAFACKYVNDTDDVFEIVQDAFLNAYKHIDRFETTRDFYPWIRKVCQNRIFNYFRTKRRKRNVHLQLVDDALWERIIEDTTSEGDGASAEKIEVLRECLRQLPKAQQDLIQKRYHFRIPVKDIAEALNATATSISMRLGRIRTKLRNCIENHSEQNTA